MQTIPFEPAPTTNINSRLDVKNLCSRKLFELLTIEDYQYLSRQQQRTVQQELEARRHYLEELSNLQLWRKTN